MILEKRDVPKVSDGGIDFETMMIDTTAGQDAVSRDDDAAALTLTGNENEYQGFRMHDGLPCCSDECSR